MLSFAAFSRRLRFERAIFVVSMTSQPRDAAGGAEEGIVRRHLRLAHRATHWLSGVHRSSIAAGASVVVSDADGITQKR